MDITTQQTLQSLIASRDYDAAMNGCQKQLANTPDDTDALYILAVCHRLQGRPDAAIDTLTRLKTLLPEYGRAFQEEGHVYRDSGQPDQALGAYALACQYNPALVASWREQLKLIDGNRFPDQHRFIGAKLARYEALPPPLIAATDLLAQGKLIKAEDLCRKFMQVNPDHVEGMRLLADIGTRLGVLDDAELLLANAHKFDPDNADVHIEYINVLRKKQKFELAMHEAEQLLASNPDNLQFKSVFAIECMQTGDYEKAISVFDEILAVLPHDPATLTSKGHALKTIGQANDATTSYEHVIENAPQYGEAYYSLANLKTYQFSASQRQSMQDVARNPNLSLADRAYLAFSLGKAFEDKQEYQQSFEQYALGNSLKKQQSRYSSEQMRDEFTEQQRVCDETLLSRRLETGHPAPDPIFILGLPRAGSTLLEQILASHSMVDGTLELPNIVALSHRLKRGQSNATAKYPEVLASLSADTLRGMGEDYIRDTMIHRAGAPFFIDKMPNNFRHIGLIKLILPNAKIIDARRHPMDCCWSGFKQLFAEGQEFSYSLEDIGEYYKGYIGLMNHWHKVLPGEILTVEHHNVVDQLEHEVRRLLEFCGLPFEQACVDFHKTERSIRTPSSEQVRQPIFRDSIAAWEHFDPWLEPLKTALGQEVLGDANNL